jgi:chorismate mutase
MSTAVSTPPQEAGSAPQAGERLQAVRQRIEQLDREVIGLIAERVRLAREVGAFKRELGLPTLDPAREAEVVRRACELARAAGLAEEDVRAIYWQLIGLSRRAQTEGG